jgi:hypothetical protein
VQPDLSRQFLGKAAPRLHGTPIQIVIGERLFPEGVQPGKRMTRRSSAWLLAFEYSDPHMTACQVMRNRRSHNPGTDDYDV